MDSIIPAEAETSTYSQLHALLYRAHVLMITHGAVLCGETPQCNGCPMRDLCEYGSLLRHEQTSHKDAMQARPTAMLGDASMVAETSLASTGHPNGSDGSDKMPESAYLAALELVQRVTDVALRAILRSETKSPCNSSTSPRHSSTSHPNGWAGLQTTTDVLTHTEQTQRDGFSEEEAVQQVLFDLLGRLEDEYAVATNSGSALVDMGIDHLPCSIDKSSPTPLQPESDDMNIIRSVDSCEDIVPVCEGPCSSACIRSDDPDGTLRSAIQASSCSLVHDGLSNEAAQEWMATITRAAASKTDAQLVLAREVLDLEVAPQHPGDVTPRLLLIENSTDDHVEGRLLMSPWTAFRGIFPMHGTYFFRALGV